MSKPKFVTEGGYISTLVLTPPLLRALDLLGGSATNEEMEDAVAKSLQLDEDTRTSLHQGGPRTKFGYRMAWTRTWLKNVDLLENSKRGVWSLTPLGKAALTWPVERLIKHVKDANAAKTGLGIEPATFESPTDIVPANEASPTIDTQSDWRSALLEAIGEMDPSAFERLCQRLLRESGFTKVEVTGKSGDGGIDGTGVLRVNLLSFHVLFQCKRWKGSVPAGTVRDFRGAMVGRTDKGLIITTGSFTADARKEATRDGAPAIDLVDGELLCELLKERGLAVKVEMVEQVTVDRRMLAEI